MNNKRPEALASPSMWRRLAAGVAALFSGQLISMVGSIAIVPVFLSRWSVDRYGEWLALSSLVAYLSALDLGMNMAGANKLTQEYARGNMAAYRDYLHSALAFYLSLATIGTAIFAAALWFSPIIGLLHLRITSPGEAKFVALIMGAEVLWAMPVGCVVAIYRTTGNLARSQWIRNWRDIAIALLTVACLYLHRGMLAMAAAQLACLVATSVGVLIHLRFRAPELLPGVAFARWSLVRGLVRPSLLFGLIVLAQAISIQGPVLLVSAGLGGAAVAVFVSSRTLANLVKQIVGIVSMALWPHVTALHAQGRESSLRSLHRHWVAASSAICASVAAALWFEGGAVISLWTGGRLQPDPVLLRLLLLQIVLQVPWQASSVVTGASNQHNRLSWSYLLSSVLGIAVSALLLSRMGLWAVPVGCIVGEAAACYHFVTHDTCSRIGQNYWQFALRQWIFLSAALSFTLFAGWAMHTIAIGPVVARCVEVGLATVIAGAAVLFLFGLEVDERRHLQSMLRPARA